MKDARISYSFQKDADGGLMKIAIYFSEKLILFLFRLHCAG